MLTSACSSSRTFRASSSRLEASRRNGQRGITSTSNSNRRRPAGRCPRASATEVEPAVLQKDSPLPLKSTYFVSLDESGLYTAAGKLQIRAPASMVYSILTDLEACPEVFDNVEDLVAYRQPGGYTDIVQNCRWTFGPFSGTFKASMKVHEEADSDSLRIVFILKESPFMREFEGRWLVRPAILPGYDMGATSQLESFSEVEHRLSVKPFLVPPGPFASMMEGVFVAQVSGILDNLLREILRREPQAGA